MIRNIVFVTLAAAFLASCSQPGTSQSTASQPAGAAPQPASSPSQEPATTPPASSTQAAPSSASQASPPSTTAGAPAATPAGSTAREAAAPPPAPPAPPPPPPAPKFKDVTIPAGTAISVKVLNALASDTSKVEDSVRATLKTPISVEGVQAIPSGTVVLGNVTSAVRSAKVKGLASVGVRFHTLDLPGEGGRHDISTATITREAQPTKKKDATKIGIGAGAGAVIGGIVGGGGGAAKGAAIGGGAGTAAVLATRGDEVHLAAGTPLSVKLTAPLTIRVEIK